MARHTGSYKSEKRKKELSRIKKQEEKRQRRLGKDKETDKTETTDMTAPPDKEPNT